MRTLALLTLLSTALIGCVSRPPAPKAIETPWRGPGLTIDSTRAEHILTLQAPTPGYSLRIDRTDPCPNGVAVFVTLRSPDPKSIQPQIVVDQHLSLGVAAARPVRVYARSLVYGQKHAENVYSFVGSAGNK